MFVAFGIWCLADVSSVSPSSELTLETSAKHYIPQATNIPYQPLLIKPTICFWPTVNLTASNEPYGDIIRPVCVNLQHKLTVLR